PFSPQTFTLFQSVLDRSHGKRKPWSRVSWVHLVVLNPSPAASYLRGWLHLALSCSSRPQVLGTD
ncbi:hypothetical protein KUCAC02_028195, partial [Chaenocephalus aceratus]